MNPVFKMFLPGKTVAKARPRFNRNTGHAFTPKTTAHQEAVIREAAMEFMERQGIDEPHEGPVRMVVVNCFGKPDKWYEGLEPAGGNKGDWDNLAKTVCDGLNRVLFKDDSLIIDGRSIKRYYDRPGVYIVVELLPKVEPPPKPRKGRKSDG